MIILVTGGAGFIGSHIAERLVTIGHQVRILDNLSSGRIENIAAFADRVTFVEGDIRDAALVEEVAGGCDLIYHEAAVVSIPHTIECPQESHDVNIQGTFNVLQAARQCGVRRVVFACSSAIYGDDSLLPKNEVMAPKPISPYGVEKIAGEYYLGAFNHLYGVETVSLRYFNVYGPRQDPSSPYSGVISIFVDCALNQRQPTVFGVGEQSRDFVFIGDVVRANMLAGTVPQATGRCYNIGRGQRTTLNQLLHILGEICDQDMAPKYEPSREGDIQHSVADITRATAEMRYLPSVDVEEGLRRLVDYEREMRGR